MSTTLISRVNMELPKFEEYILRKYGKELLPLNKVVEKRSSNKIVNVSFYYKDISVVDEDFILEKDFSTNTEIALDDIINGIIRAHKVANSHKGLKLRLSVCKYILKEMEYISIPIIMNNYNYSRRHATTYFHVCRQACSHFQRFDLKRSLELLSKFAYIGELDEQV